MVIIFSAIVISVTCAVTKDGKERYNIGQGKRGFAASDGGGEGFLPSPTPRRLFRAPSLVA